MQTVSKPLSNLQLELIKLFPYNLEESKLMEIKKILMCFFEKNATQEMDILWTESNWNNQTMDMWLLEHNRSIKV